METHDLTAAIQQYESVGALLAARAAEHPDRTLLKWESQSISYQQMFDDACRVAHSLSEQGIAKGDRVAVMMATSPDWLRVWFGTVLLGGVLVPINSAHIGDGLLYQLNDSEAAAVIIDAEFVERVEAVAQNLSIKRVFVRGPVPDTSTLSQVESLDKLMGGTTASVPAVSVWIEDPATILYTSGTTGPPKGCVLPHGQYVAAAFLHADHCGYDADTVIYTCLPLFHINAQIYSVLSAVSAGATLAMDQRFSASRFWGRLRAVGATAFNFVGSMAISLWNQPPSPQDRDHNAAVAFGVPIPLDIWGEWEERFGCKVVYAYGMTENALPAIFHHNETPVLPRLRGAAGKGSLTTEVAIVDDRDNPVAAGVTGEIVTRPRIPWTMMTEYWRKPQATIEAFRGCWFHTGDLGYVDSDGYLFYVDRKKDAVRRKGEMVSSWEVETAVGRFAAVEECAMVAVPSEMGEDEIMVVVVPRDGALVDPAELIEFCRDRIPKFQIPRYVRIVADLPMTATARVAKYQLRKEGVTADTWDAAAAPTIGI
ncbi:AMP-binding protein [Mycobacterium sp.]|uniref:AMP-binding protein n=1 Tax=Mycobacterium sp. TaxID=1785 RepID=UPI003D0F5205